MFIRPGFVSGIQVEVLDTDDGPATLRSPISDDGLGRDRSDFQDDMFDSDEFEAAGDLYGPDSSEPVTLRPSAVQRVWEGIEADILGAVL